MRKAPSFAILALIINIGIFIAPCSAQNSKPSMHNHWAVREVTNAVTGEVTKVADNNSDNVHLIVRKIGSRVEIYVATPDYLGTMENLENRESEVAYKFDSGPVVNEVWYLGVDDDSIFCPNSTVQHFLTSLRGAKKLAFQYQPHSTEPKSGSFDVSGFPLDF